MDEYSLTKIRKEEESLKESRKHIDAIMTQTQASQIATNKISEHNTMVDNAMKDILGDKQDDQTLIQINSHNNNDQGNYCFNHCHI